MRVPPFERLGVWTKGLGLFVCGMVVGSAVYMSLHHEMYTLLAIKNQKLQNQLDELTEQQKAQDKTRSRATYIGKIDVQFIQSSDPKHLIDEVTVQELETKVRSNLRGLSGKSAIILKEAPLAFYTLVEEPTYKTTSAIKYKVSVKMFVFYQSVLTVSVTAREDTSP